MKKLYIIIGMVLIANVSIAQLIITTQAELNALSSTSVIGQDLIITTVSAQDSSTMVTDLSPLLGIDSILGNLEIRHTALTDLSGLANIKYVDEVWIYENTVLKSLVTMDGPLRIHRLSIYNNPYLIESSDFTFSKGLFTLTIRNNHRLKALNISFNELEWSSFKTNISVFENPKLEEIRINDPSSQMVGIGIDSNIVLKELYLGSSNDSLRVTIRKCDSIKQVTGFQDVQYLIWLEVKNNLVLDELCFVKQTLQRQGVLWLQVGNNAPGANSEAEIMATDCSNFNTGINELEYNQLTIHPNPAHNEVFVKMPDKVTPYQIYDMSGKVVQQGKVETNGRIGLSAVSGGMYILLIGENRSKLVIQ